MGRFLLLIIKWLLRAWFFIIPILLIVIHYNILSYYATDKDEINKLIALCLQLTGGLLVLYSIDSNIGLFKGDSLIGLFGKWLKSIPLFKKNIVIKVGKAELKLSGGIGKARFLKGGKTIEEKIEALQEQINWLKEDLQEESRNINKKLSESESRLNTQIQETNSKLRLFEGKIEQFSVGGIGSQVCGVLLMFHGAVAGYLV